MIAVMFFSAVAFVMAVTSFVLFAAGAGPAAVWFLVGSSLLIWWGDRKLKEYK